MAKSPVTIGEFHVFAMAARGYERVDLWAPADFAQFHGKGQVCAPLSASLPAGSDPDACSDLWEGDITSANSAQFHGKDQLQAPPSRPSLLAVYMVQKE